MPLGLIRATLRTDDGWFSTASVANSQDNESATMSIGAAVTLCDIQSIAASMASHISTGVYKMSGLSAAAKPGKSSANTGRRNPCLLYSGSISKALAAALTLCTSSSGVAFAACANPGIGAD
jgi:hypothetical protein